MLICKSISLEDKVWLVSYGSHVLYKLSKKMLIEAHKLERDMRLLVERNHRNGVFP